LSFEKSLPQNIVVWAQDLLAEEATNITNKGKIRSHKRSARNGKFHRIGL
jgi:hypothetical protein